MQKVKKKTKNSDTIELFKSLNLPFIQGIYTIINNFVLISTGFKNWSTNTKIVGSQKVQVISTYFLDLSEINQESQDRHFGAKCHECTSQHLCYVFRDNVSVKKAFQKGQYIEVSLDIMLSILMQYIVRLGTYGDPSVLPKHFLLALKSRKVLAYTHFWNDFNLSNTGIMASVETLALAEKARRKGYRVFLNNIENHSNDFLKENGFILCPNEDKGISCVQCKLCTLGTPSKVKDIYINPHGSFVTESNIEKTLKLIEELEDWSYRPIE
tara:strand:- start:301 stop:1107 length:807 start_codon:yes stop_codon:yes gene_type:complete